MADGGDMGYSFPVLNSKKIVGHLSDLRIHVSEEVRSLCTIHTAAVEPIFIGLRSYDYSYEGSNTAVLSAFL